ncbi:peptide MFS transporter [Moritella viscosa]|uniref:Transport protein, PTR2 family n=1 Tax=Moritella viscosa TaxID=80854 RepID=A0A1K9ZR18_9GAMM|nr:peptide MFS transporter [Moritella viscosa]SGY95773.1 Putative transport protein, PTR2 family [Moritella viscosa]SGZ01781.1 Putative transport protein, PTR2 family [Moritella viscosa]SGZ07978.1 Putative transport protein, PTR2 family [Moritella viscosa]SGZ08115.1 Putative transport protein, PTR2 family [Moritella viscosa]SHO10209.1 Putative transport protein, PTR2 family [Moritella viscosa]
MWNRLNKSMMCCQMLFGLSFYGVMVILTRFFLEDLGYSEADTMMVVGAFSSIGPLFAIAGGFIADKFLGAYRSLTIAYLGFAVGYTLLVLGASAGNVPLSLVGIALASYARGLMSPSYPSLYKRTFSSQEDFENGYPVNYSVNNIGAFLGQYLFPMLVLMVGFNGSFMLSATMAAVAFVILIVSRKPLLTVGAEIDQTPVSTKNWIAFIAISLGMIGLVFFMFSNMDIGQNVVYAIGAAAILYFISLMLKAERADALKMGTILIMTALTTAFFVYYGQMMTSMTMVTINTMRGDLFGFIPIAPEAAMAMNPLWCIVGGPVIAYVFSALEKRNINFTTATKVGFSFILTAIAFGILTMAVLNVGEDVIIRPEVFMAIHFFQAFAEVIVGSMVVAFILSVAPKHIENFSVSLFSVAIAMSGIVGAVFSTSIAMEKGQEITQEVVKTVYGDYFSLLTGLAVVMVFVAFLASFVIRKMLEKSKEAEGMTTAQA